MAQAGEGLSSFGGQARENMSVPIVGRPVMGRLGSYAPPPAQSGAAMNVGGPNSPIVVKTGTSENTVGNQ